MKQCPACLPPHNEGCATCGGTSEVTEEVYSQFMIKKLELQSNIDFARKIQEALHTNDSLEETVSAIKTILEDY
jgi:hypothetical protein